MIKIQGLSDVEATKLLKEKGFNEISSQKPKSIFSLLKSVLQEPMIFLLLISGIVYLFLGEPKDSFVLFISIFFVIGITFYQERKTENALQALKDLSSPRALVIRNGEQKRIPGREVVVGDYIILQEGDRVPADAVVINIQNLLVDESLLTGESLPVRKEMGNKKTEIKNGLDNPTLVFSGTLVSQGSGMAKVIKTGVNTEMGKIGKSLETIVDTDSLLKKEIVRIVRIFGVIGITSCVVIFLFYWISQNDFLNGILRGLTLSMSILPEEFPVVLTIFLALGAWRISKENVLARNHQAIETLGAITVLCVDKTGTLTQNRMEISTLVSGNDSLDITDNAILQENGFKDLLLYAKLASKREAFDNLEKEINSSFEKHIAGGKKPIKDWHLIKAYDRSGNILATTRVWKSPENKNYIVASKGAPETIMSLCRLNSKDRELWMKKVEELTKKGQRVLGAAKGKFDGNNLPESQDGFELNFLGLVGFTDPLRKTAPLAMKECYQAGIRVIMITGDHPGTAEFIAAQAGIKNPGKIITGSELYEMDGSQLKERIASTNVFARVVPDQKLKIVEALKENGEIVAMTGDGVNDGPALKAAHIGIAMGQKGTDVARESADIVLLDDDFSSIVAAVKMGRRIYDNLKKAVSYIYSIHIPIIGISLITTFWNLPLLLFPIHIAFLEFIIDPASSIVFETEVPERDIMKRPPRSLKKPLFDKSIIRIGLVRGLLVLGAVLITFIVFKNFNHGDEVARTTSFITLVLGNLILISSNLTETSIFKKFELHRNKSFFVILTAAIISLFMIMNVGFLRELFHFTALNISQVVTISIVALICFLLFELMKIFKIEEAIS